MRTHDGICVLRSAVRRLVRAIRKDKQIDVAGGVWHPTSMRSKDVNSLGLEGLNEALQDRARSRSSRGADARIQALQTLRSRRAVECRHLSSSPIANAA